MRGLRPAFRTLLTAVMCVAAIGPAGAEGGRHRWYFGGSVSYDEPTDSIRSNAAIVESTAFGDDGVPYTGDPNEQMRCPTQFGFDLPVFCDPRPDDQVARGYELQGNYRIALNAGWAPSRYLSIQLDVSRSTGSIDPIDLYTHEVYPVLDRFGNPAPYFIEDISTTQYSTGTLTQTPVTLTGIVRFRPNGTLRPYLGAGFGRIFYAFDRSDDTARLNELLGSQRITAVGNEFGVDITGGTISNNTKPEGRVPFANQLTINIDDSNEWHLAGGVEYVINDRLSILFDARYAFVDQDLVLDFDGEDQIDVLYYPQELFRPDGSLLFYAPGPYPLHPLCYQSGYRAYGCWQQDPFSTRVDPTAVRAPLGGGSVPDPGVTCPTRGDFNDDGVMDICYGPGIHSPQGITDPKGIYVSQGGSIGLDSFAVSIGLRVKF